MSAFLYPGQGSQAPGMGADLYEQFDTARAIFDEAAQELGADFLNTIFEGSVEEVTDTRIAQTGLLTVGAAITRVLADRGITPTTCTGHSLGEFTALVAAGSLEFGDALRLVRERARLMAEEAAPGSMAAVVAMEPQAIAAALPDSVTIANFNGPSQTIISGTTEGIEEAAVALKEAGAKRVLPLKVSGAFHSPLMAPAAEKFASAVNAVTIVAPSCTFVSSVSAQVESDPEAIRTLLAKQMASPVRWTEVMATVGQGSALEVGPGKVLQGLAKRMDGAPDIVPAGTVESIESLN